MRMGIWDSVALCKSFDSLVVYLGVVSLSIQIELSTSSTTPLTLRCDGIMFVCAVHVYIISLPPWRLALFVSPTPY